MINVISPRCVAIHSDLPASAGAQQFRLDDILSIDLIEGPRHGETLTLDLLSGQHVVAARYVDPGEAGADFGMLRVLLGMSAWPEELQENAESAPGPTGRLRHYVSLCFDLIAGGRTAKRAETSRS